VPRNKPLIVGPSGVGKTALVRRLCDLQELSLLVVNAGGWIPYGAYTTPHTLTVIRNFVSRNPRGCLMIDEIDKACPHDARTFSHSWSLGVFTEIVSLLDGDAKLTTSGWTAEQMIYLRQNFFLIGAGAWQATTASREGDAEKQSYSEKMSSAVGIPEEIVYRFNPKLIELTPPGRRDYAQAISRVRTSLGLQALSAADEQSLLDEAERSRVGMRWVEQYLTQLLIQQPRVRVQVTPSNPKVSEKVRITSRELDKRLAEFRALLVSSQEPVAQLEAKLRCQLQMNRGRREKKKRLLFSLAETETMIGLLSDYGNGLHHDSQFTRAEQRHVERLLYDSGERLFELLIKCISTKSLDLQAAQLLEPCVQVLVLTRRMMATWRYLVNVGISDDPI
jgi:hypothetical protein